MRKYHGLNFVPPKIHVLTLFGNRIISDINKIKIRTLGWTLIPYD